MTRFRLSTIVLAVTLAAAPLACSHPAAPAAGAAAVATPLAGGPPQPNGPSTGTAAERRAPARQRQPAQAPVAEAIRIPAGTTLEVRLDAPVSSASAAAGEVVAAELAAPLEVNGEVVAPVGSPAEARIESAVPSGHLAGRAQLALTLTAITPGDRRLAVTTDTLTRTGPSHTKRNERMIGGGAIIGAIAAQLLGGHTRDTLRGAAVGAAAGTGVAAAKGRLDVTIGAGQVVPFTLLHDLVVPREATASRPPRPA